MRRDDGQYIMALPRSYDEPTPEYSHSGKIVARPREIPDGRSDMTNTITMHIEPGTAPALRNAEIHIRASRAIRTLEARAKEYAKEVRERISKLEQTMESIEVAEQTGQSTLLDVPTTLSPDVLELLDDPGAGL